MKRPVSAERERERERGGETKVHAVDPNISRSLNKKRDREKEDGEGRTVRQYSLKLGDYLGFRYSIISVEGKRE